jgi:regulatory protein
MGKRDPQVTPEGSLLKAKSDALRLLSVRPRSLEEMRGRLRLKKYPDGVIGEVLALFKRQGLLDDEKFAKLFAQSRLYSRPVGKRELEFELRKKGLSKELVSRTIEDLGEYDETEIAYQLVFSRFHKMTGVSPEKKKARLFGFLKRRGFSNAAIFSVLSKLFKDQENLGDFGSTT